MNAMIDDSAHARRLFEVIATGGIAVLDMEDVWFGLITQTEFVAFLTAHDLSAFQTDIGTMVIFPRQYEVLNGG